MSNGTKSETALTSPCQYYPGCGCPESTFKNGCRTVEPPCETCNDDPAVCASVPGLRHCEAAGRVPSAASLVEAVGADRLVKIDDGQGVHVRTAREWLELARRDFERRALSSDSLVEQCAKRCDAVANFIRAANVNATAAIHAAEQCAAEVRKVIPSAIEDKKHG